MTRYFLMMTLGAGAMMLATAQLQAQPRPCSDHAAITAKLAEVYREHRRMIGLANNNTVVEVFASDGGSWTIAVTHPGGPTCIVAAGQHFQLQDDPLANLDSES